MARPAEHDHSTTGIAQRLSEGHTANYLRDWIYGGIDGAVTTFAIVAGVEGASLSSRVVLTLGIANLVAELIIIIKSQPITVVESLLSQIITADIQVIAPSTHLSPHQTV